MSHDSTRKSFLTKFLGLAAVGTVAPRALAASLVPLSPPPATGSTGALLLRPDPRAVARREGAA